MADVFISYHRSDDASDWVRRTADELESMGISCWYAPRDTSPGAFVPSILTAIDTCRVFLMLWDEGSNGPGYVFNELVQAFNLYKKERHPIIIPFKVGHFQTYRDLNFYLIPFHIFNGGDSLRTARTEELITKIALELGRELVSPITETPLQETQGQTDNGPELPSTETPLQETQGQTDNGPELPSTETPLQEAQGQTDNGPELPSTETPLQEAQGQEESPQSSEFKDAVKFFIVLIIAITLAFVSIKSLFFSQNADKTWDLRHGVLTIYGNGDMQDYGIGILQDDGPPWHKSASKIIRAVISDGITSIGRCAFSDCENLIEVKIPDSVTSIKYGAFHNCDSLTSVIIPDSVTSIGDSAFWSCDSLTSVMIPDSVTSIGDSAFWDCGSLTIVAIPDSVTSIGDSAFWGCGNLTSVAIPDSVTSIGDSAFWSCDSLTSVMIPDNLTSIGDSAFAACENLTQFTANETHSTYGVVDGVLFNKYMSKLICYPAGRQDEEYAIPNGVINIGNSAFHGCGSLISVSVPDGVTSIGEYAFYGCQNLTSVNIPDSVTDIGAKAFDSCSSLENVSVPANSIISPSAFSQNTSVTRRE